MSLRAQLETVLGGRISTPFTDLNKRVRETASTGINAFDAKTGGLPRGAITEIFGLPSTGKTSMLLSILAAATAREEVCALVDSGDAFSPESGDAAGIELKRLLWVRCHNLDHTLKAADLLLQGGGFGVVALDVTDIPAEKLQSVPLATWFRFQRSIEKTPTILTIISQEAVAKTCTALAVKMADCEFRIAERKTHALPSHSVLLAGAAATGTVIRSRQPIESQNVRFHLYSSFSRPGARS